jgi:hypothetical protein
MSTLTQHLLCKVPFFLITSELGQYHLYLCTCFLSGVGGYSWAFFYVCVLSFDMTYGKLLVQEVQLTVWGKSSRGNRLWKRSVNFVAIYQNRLLLPVDVLSLFCCCFVVFSVVFVRLASLYVYVCVCVCVCVCASVCKCVQVCWLFLFLLLFFLLCLSDKSKFSNFSFPI